MNDAVFDYSKLKELIQDDGYTLKQFSKMISISYYSLYKNLRNIVPFTQTEIMRICKILNINPSEVTIYFFTEKVEKTQF